MSSIALANGTAFTPSQAQHELMAALLLDGVRWMSLGSPARWDWSVRGRDLGSVPRRLDFNTSQMRLLHTRRADELAAFARAIDGVTGTDGHDGHPLGHRGFWTSDYAVIHSESDAGMTWMSSVHMHSNRTVSARCVNGQGAMNEHTGDGMVYTYYPSDNARGYDGAFANWDWRRLPGITAAVESEMLVCNYSQQLLHDSQVFMNATGTVSDGLSGISALRLRSHGAEALKAVAMVPQGLVHLVSGVTCNKTYSSTRAFKTIDSIADNATMNACGEIVTTIENRVSQGPGVFLMCNHSLQRVMPGTLRQGYHGCNWAWHNSTGYLIQPDTTILITNGAETNKSLSLFSIAIPHDTLSPSSTASPKWVMTIPGTGLDAMRSVSSKGNDLVIIANNERIQAVWDVRRVQVLAAIWVANETHPVNLTWAPVLSLSAIRVDRPCLLLIRQSSDCGSFTVTASDPSNDAHAVQALHVTLTGDVGACVCVVPPCPCATEGSDTSVVLQLPQGYDAGRSVDVTCIPHMC